MSVTFKWRPEKTCTFRQEPDARLEGLTESMRGVLLALASGKPLYRYMGGYVLCDDVGKPIPPIHKRVTIDAVIRRGLAQRFVIIATGPRRIQVRLTGEGAWTARTLLKRGRAS